MKNKNKGFTLIELLVVVAIIGILAAVGTVAYTGYTASAKKSASKSNHANVVKYVAAEMAKCNVESTAFDDWDCANKALTTDKGPASAAAAALSDFKDPYGVTVPSITSNDSTLTASVLQGNTVVSSDGTNMQVSTCVAKECDEATTDDPPVLVNMMTNAVAID